MKSVVVRDTDLPGDLKCVVTLRELRALKAKIHGQRKALRSKEIEVARLKQQVGANEIEIAEYKKHIRIIAGEGMGWK